MPEYEKAIRYALNQLETRLPSETFYHSLSHTRDVVLPAVETLGRLSQVSEYEQQLLRVGAAFHDIGFVGGPAGHELRGARVAAQVLPEMGFANREIERVMGMILATRLPQQPYNPLEEIVADGDLDVLGRDDFLEQNDLLRRELDAFAIGTAVDQCAWYQQQVTFLENHSFFTSAARKLRDEGKQRNLMALRDRLLMCLNGS